MLIDTVRRCDHAQIADGRKVQCDVVEFGYLIDPEGRPLRNFGRHVTRMTAGYHRGYLPVALPDRLASHVAALPLAIDPSLHAAGALIVLPSYIRDGGGALDPVAVTLQRIALVCTEDRPDLPGDSVHSAAWTFDWQDYGGAALCLPDLLQRLQFKPATLDEGRRSRLEAARLSLELPVATPEAASSRVQQVILGAISRGARLRLDRRWCRDEREFLQAFFGALGHLPAALRGHVSAAAGLLAPDRGFQITWSPDARGLAPEGGAAEALVAAARSARLSAAPTMRIADPGEIIATAGLLSPSFAEAGLHGKIRLAMRQWFAPEGAGRAPLMAAEALGLVAAYMDGGDLTPADADRIMALALTSRAGELAGLSNTLASEPDAAAVLQLLCGSTPPAVSRDVIAAAVEICEKAEAHYDDPHTRAVRRLAGDCLSAELAALACPSEAELDALQRREGLALTVARGILLGDRTIVTAVRRGLAVLAQRHGRTDPLVVETAGRLLPRDPRINSDWRDYADDDACLVQALYAAAKDGRYLAAPEAATLTDKLLCSGHWNLVRDALQEVTARLGRRDADEPHDSAADRRRLTLAGTLIERMAQAS